ncbi:MAG: tRNA pseudouridine synthase A [Deltaproteobacteria bacterium]|nr:tRNA pseudouridine synthase A [Deltaproteobacteria bacterium]
MDRFTYRVQLAYRGSAFAGFARQPGQITVEGVVVAALSPLIPELQGVSVGGRTDRGVHAIGQVISFWSRRPLETEAIEAALDRAQPGDLSASDVRLVPRRFHAQHSAQLRRYAYFYEDSGRLDAALLDRLVGALSGRRSFHAFARDTSAGASCVRRLYQACAVRIDPRTIRFDFGAEGFLRRQVRVMVATALREAQHGADDEALLRLAEQGDRRATAAPADPDGLYLTYVGYEPLRTRARRIGR